MENKINIAELLKDCPKGMELNCTIFNNITFEYVNDRGVIWIKYIDSNGNSKVIHLTSYGEIELQHIKTKCVIFPKDKTTWEGFQRPFKDGDIVTYEYKNGLIFMILKKFVNFVEIYHHCALYDNAKEFVTNTYIVGEPKYTRPATEEEKQKLFDAIKTNGYEWNAETKTLEKLIKPKFKVGDRIKHRLTGEVYIVLFVLSNGYGGGVYDVTITNKIKKSINIEEQDDYELVHNKFDITTLVPFESRVLVRNVGAWEPAFWGYYSKEYAHPFVVAGGNTFAQCISYEGNEHLRGKTNDCDDFYKTWEK